MRSLFITIRLQTFLRALLQQHLQLQRPRLGMRTSVTGSFPAATVRPELLEFATSAGRIWWVMAVWETQCVVCVNESLKRHLSITDFHFANLQHEVLFFIATIVSSSCWRKCQVFQCLFKKEVGTVLQLFKEEILILMFLILMYKCISSFRFTLSLLKMIIGYWVCFSGEM